LHPTTSGCVFSGQASRAPRPATAKTARQLTARQQRAELRWRHSRSVGGLQQLPADYTVQDGLCKPYTGPRQAKLMEEVEGAPTGCISWRAREFRRFLPSAHTNATVPELCRLSKARRGFPFAVAHEALAAVSSTSGPNSPHGNSTRGRNPAVIVRTRRVFLGWGAASLLAALSAPKLGRPRARAPPAFKPVGWRRFPLSCRLAGFHSRLRAPGMHSCHLGDICRGYVRRGRVADIWISDIVRLDHCSPCAVSLAKGAVWSTIWPASWLVYTAGLQRRS
jgi:hypothetical protein